MLSTCSDHPDCVREDSLSQELAAPVCFHSDSRRGVIHFCFETKQQQNDIMGTDGTRVLRRKIIDEVSFNR